MKLMLRIARKEVSLFFSSPVAYLFLAVFALVTLFIFFWGESFFARNIADVRPLFEWMPVLLIFMCSTLTMRQWSEERRTGTLEHVLTQPAPLWTFVVGKFLGCLWLLLIALVVTLPLPVTVSIFSELDWGPVLAGYVAAFFLGAAYLSIGLFVSARCNNQIVSLILSVAVCGVFYLIGSSLLTSFVDTNTGEWMRLFGAGSRFESITRGVIDVRDLYYYLSIVLVFLALTTFFLERERWSGMARTDRHKAWRWITGLLVANVLFANVWLMWLNKLRVDTTAGQQYSISNATQSYLDQLQEPLLIRGYFSAKTHPLLAPLVPQMRDLIKEYEIAADGRLRAEFIDPLQHPELEEQAREQYGVEPVPFQVASRHQSSIVNSYFNVLVQYGSEHELLSFRDLIDVKASGATDVDVQLRNPEHDLTRAIKRVLTNYQAGGNLFDTVQGEVDFIAYVSEDPLLPAELQQFRQTVDKVVDEVAAQSQGRLKASFIDPLQNNGEVARQIAGDFGFQPMAADVFSNNRFYFHMILRRGDQIVQIPLDDLSEGGFERNLNAGIKRFATGFTRTVALASPAPKPDSYGNQISEFNQLRPFLGAELNVVDEDLSDGTVDATADLLLVVAPQHLEETALFAVDQFLMQGGRVIALTSPYKAQFSPESISLQLQQSGLETWLTHHGIALSESVVLDPQNAAFPAPVVRTVGGMQIQEMHMINYPYFIDVRGEGLNQDNPITAQLPQLSVPWASPITIDEEKNAERVVTTLLSSSAKSWLSTSTDIMPKLQEGSVAPYQPEGEIGAQTLAVIVEGKFDSFFAEKESPLLQSGPVGDDAEGAEAAEAFNVGSVINRSPESSRLLLIASNDFLNDQAMQLASAANGAFNLSSMQLVANAIDWSLEDTGLMEIRARGQFNRTLPPLSRGSQLFWEYLNYGLVVLLVLAIAVCYRLMRSASRKKNQKLYAGEV